MLYQEFFKSIFPKATKLRTNNSSWLIRVNHVKFQVLIPALKFREEILVKVRCTNILLFYLSWVSMGARPLLKDTC